jgi:hypothetical protein
MVGVELLLVMVAGLDELLVKEFVVTLLLSQLEDVRL